MRNNPLPQEIYRHFKGNCYQILTLAYHSETAECMVVYQQLYSPFEVYVRPLEMFMSEVDDIKYPNASQKYRFERLDISRNHEQTFKQSDINNNNLIKNNNCENPQSNVFDDDKEEKIHPGLMAFLDTDSYERKLEILSSLYPVITNEMIDTMAVSLDTEIKPGEIEQRYNEIKNCLITMERFECNRLRGY